MLPSTSFPNICSIRITYGPQEDLDTENRIQSTPLKSTRNIRFESNSRISVTMRIEYDPGTKTMLHLRRGCFQLGTVVATYQVCQER